MISVALFVLIASGCTTLGPMPATTGVSAMPIGRPGVDVQGGGVPGFYASEAVKPEPTGTPISSISALFDPDHWLPAKGVIVGGRAYGNGGGDTPVEPFVGYRREVDRAVSVAAIAYGTASRAENQLATYHGTRVGGEAAVGARVWSVRDWLALHAQGAAAVTRILLSGRYCVDAAGDAKDCDMMNPQSNSFASARTVDVYPSATGTLALELGKRAGVFDRARVALIGSVGRMPVIDNGERTGTTTYASIGVTWSLSFGFQTRKSHEQ